jgi:Flp pilus assembly protein TadD
MKRGLATRAAMAVAAGAVAMGLASCGHGTYTSEGLSMAQEKSAALKSGAEWTSAQQQFLAGDLDKALKSVNASIAINDRYAKSHVLRGRILIEKGDLDNARNSLLRAEQLDPKYPDTQYYLGIIHERFNQPAEALQRYSKAAELDPKNPQYLVASAEMMIQQDRLDDAQALIDANRPTFQYTPAVKQTEGHIAMIRGQHETAAKLFGEARLLAPDDLSIVEDLARAQMASGNWSEAEYNLAKLIDGAAAKGSTQRRDLMHMRVQCLLRLDRPVEARTTLLALTGGPEGEKDLKAWINLGNVAAILNDSARLKAAAGKVIAIAPDTYEGHYLRGLQLHRQGESRAALASLEKATALNTTDPGPLVLRGLVQQDLGMNREARASFEAAARLAPADKRINTLLSAVATQ